MQSKLQELEGGRRREGGREEGSGGGKKGGKPLTKIAATGQTMSPGRGRKEVVKVQAALREASDWKVVGGHCRSLQVPSRCAALPPVWSPLSSQQQRWHLFCTFASTITLGCVSRSNYTMLSAAVTRNSGSRPAPPSPAPWWHKDNDPEHQSPGGLKGTWL